MLNIVGNYSRTSPLSESRTGEDRAETRPDALISGGENVRIGRRPDEHRMTARRRLNSAIPPHCAAGGAAERKTRTGQFRVPAARPGRGPSPSGTGARSREGAHGSPVAGGQSREAGAKASGTRDGRPGAAAGPIRWEHHERTPAIPAPPVFRVRRAPEPRRVDGAGGEPSRTGDSPTLLVKIFGKDRPGITAGLFDTLAAYAVDVVDIEQVVTRGRIVLCALVTPPAVGGSTEGDLRATVHSWADSLNLQAEIISGIGDNRPRGDGRSYVTVLGHPLTAESTAAIAASITSTGGNIDRIFRLAKYPVTAVEFAVSGTGTEQLRTALATEAAEIGVDVAVVSAGLSRRAQRLVVMDVDSTLIQDEVIELFAAHAGCEDKVAEVTEQAMRGELDFEQSLHARVALLAGLDASVVDKVRAEVRLTPGARTLIRTLKRLGYQVGVVSGGFTQVTDDLKERLGLDFASANTLEVVDGRLTGRVVGEVVDRAGKARLLRSFAEQAGVPLAQTVAIGDGANDLDMLNTAGLGVAFNAKPVVREAAHTAVNVPFLDTVLYLLGITREEVEAADGLVG